MAGKLDAGCPSPTLSLSPSTAMPNVDLLESHLNLGYGNIPHKMQYRRTVSSNDASSSKPSRRIEDNLFCKWKTAMQCKQHVGTREWVYCKEKSCQQLKDELHHLLECPYKMIGGCKKQCIPLKKELQTLRNLIPKYPTISHPQFGHQHDQRVGNGHIKMECDEIHAKLQALNIEEYVAAFSPSSPAIDEPFQSLLERNHEMDIERTAVPIVELVPLDENELSVINGCFRKGHEWEKLSFLGKGTFGTTYLCYDKPKNSHFAIKKLPVSGFNMDEVKIWRGLSGKHPNILTLFGAVQRKERVLIFMEYMNGGSVSDYLAKYNHLSEKMALQLLYQVLCGLEFMHKNCIVHGDVKAGNVLMDDLGVHVKLADFGSCVDLRSIEAGGRTKLTGTLAFMAPEVCRSEFPSTSSDIWSAMCFFIQMVSGNAPWDEYRHQLGGLLFVIGSAKRPPLLPPCSEAVQEMFAQGLNVEARSRPSAAELIRHRVFNFDESSIEVPSEEVYDGLGMGLVAEDDNSSVNDDSLEYHSSQSPFCSDLDLSDEEYFSSTDDVDSPSDVTSSKAKPDLMNSKNLDKKGGVLEVADVKLTVPVNALQDSTRIGIRCVDPVHFYQPLIDNNLYKQVHILGHVHQLSPAGQRFRKPVSLKVSLSEELHQSEDILVFHGNVIKSKNSITWKDITSSSSVLPFKNSTTVTLTTEHFSCLLFLKSLPSLARELVSCFNFQAMLFRFLVLVRLDPDDCDCLDVCVVVMRESFHASSCMEAVNTFSVCQQLKENKGFRVMYGSRREYIFPKEQLEVSVENSSNVVSRSNQAYAVQCLFGGEVIDKWRLDASFFQEPFSGAVSVKRSTGQVYRFQFWEHEPTRYVQDVLNFASLTHTNMIPLAKAAGLDEVEITKLIEETPNCDEELQLRKITECWERKAENSELMSLEIFVARVPKEELLVSDRGKFHLGHLNHFSEKWNQNNNRGETVTEGELFLRKMAENGKEMCQSILSDCFLQIDHSEDAVRLATDVSKSMKKVLENVGEHYPQFTSQLLNKLMILLVSDQGNQVMSATQAHLFCHHLSRCIPWLIQIVKDLFKVHVAKPPTGMWGLFPEVFETDGVAEEELLSNEVWCQICEVLRKLCERNLWKVGDDVDLDEMESTLSVNGMLMRLSLADKEWSRLTARVKYFRHSSKEITRNKLSRISGQDLQNVLQWLQRYVTFCPTRLVQFTPKMSGSKVVQQPLLYCQESKSFTQTFCLTVEDSVVVEFAVKTNINGRQYSEIIEVPFQVCEEAEEEHHGGCTTFNVVYKHNEDGTGSLKISNDCQKVFLDRIIEDNTNEIDGEQTATHEELNEEMPAHEELNEEMTAHEELNEEMTAHDAPPEEMVISEKATQEMTAHVPEITNIKEGSPLESELNEIARKIPKEWKALGRRLLSTSAVEEIDMDEDQVAEKSTKMLEKWKKSKGSCATYEELYHALCSELVERKDIADEYCVTMSQEL